MAVRQRVVYLHGFNSSPDSIKARLFVEYCQKNTSIDVIVPSLPYDPVLVLAVLEKEVVAVKDDIALLVGSSLGGYYATHLAERYGFKVALINPAVAPCDHLDEGFLGFKRNPYTGEEYEFTVSHANSLRLLNVEKIKNTANYFLLVQTGDKVLDYRDAVDLYAGCKQLVQVGGSHSFQNFAAVLPLIMEFADLL